MTGVQVDWQNATDENGNEVYDLTCPNTAHHERFGYSWETQYEATKDKDGKRCAPYQGCPCCEDDSGRIDVMWNTIWRLDYDGMVTDDIRVKILKETSCGLIQNTQTEEWFICLRGCGMDFSPHIAYAFYLAQKWLPLWLLQDLKAGWCKDNLGKTKFARLRRIVIEQSEREAQRFLENSAKWKKRIKDISQ